MTRDDAGIRQRLAAAMAQARLRWAGADLEMLPDSGLAHTHVRLVGHRALARIPKQSQINLAAGDARAPLMSGAASMVDLLAQTQAQAAYLDAAQIDPAARRRINAEIDRYRSVSAQPPRPPLCLISFDAQPGNILVRADGCAVLVDLEKYRYDHASLDLAHATLYTSTTWDAASSAALGVDQVAGAYVDRSQEMGSSASASNEWHVPLRRAMWRVASSAVSPARLADEDWSTELGEPALMARVRGRVDHCLSTAIVEQVPGEIDALEQTLVTTAEQDEVIIEPHLP